MNNKHIGRDEPKFFTVLGKSRVQVPVSNDSIVIVSDNPNGLSRTEKRKQQRKRAKAKSKRLKEKYGSK